MINEEKVYELISKYFEIKELEGKEYIKSYNLYIDKEYYGYLTLDLLHDKIDVCIFDEYAFLQDDILLAAKEISNE